MTALYGKNDLSFGGEFLFFIISGESQVSTTSPGSRETNYQKTFWD